MLVLLPLLYVLSVGPVVWLADHGYVGEWVGNIYRPLLVLARNGVEPLRAYIEFWSPKPSPVSP